MNAPARPPIPRGTRRGQRLLIFVALALAGSAVLVLSLPTWAEIEQPRTALAFGALICLGELARLRLPGGREFAPIATAGGLAYALLLGIGDAAALHGPYQVIVVSAGAIALGAVPHAAAGRSICVDDMVRRFLVIAVVALAFRPLAGALAPARELGWVTVGALAGAVLAAGAVEVVLATIATPGSWGSRFRIALGDEMRVRLPLGLAIGASALLTTLAAHVMGWAALPVCMTPLVVTQVAYRRYAGIRATYLQTIRALSRVTEVGGYVEPGHSRRVSHLAVRIGRRLNMPETRLLQLEYAALMHDIGQLSRCSSKVSGATVYASEEEQRRIAELGASVVRQTGVLEEVAEIVARQAEPYEGVVAVNGSGPPGAEFPDRSGSEPPLESRIIRVANDYDDLTGGVARADGNGSAVRHIHGAVPGQYDPDVVRALTHVLDHN